MFFTFVFVALCVVSRVQARQPSTGFELPEDIAELCPHTDFCETNSSKPRPLTENGSQPCCEPCSCAPDCGLTRRCCTTEMDRYKLNAGSVCKALNTKEYVNPDEETYHVMERCLEDKETCTSTNVSSWGSYSPVYSRSNGFIYHNIHCATCNNQIDTVSFIPTVICTSVEGPLSKVTSMALQGDRQSGECFVKFIVPNNLDVSSEVCRSVVVRTCSCNLNNTYYSHLNDLCERFEARFRRAYSYYQNVYCFLCNICDHNYTQDMARWNELHTMCPVIDKERFFIKHSLIILLDRRSPQRDDTSGSAPLACFETNNNSTSKVCRPVHCPEGQFRQDGKCELLGKMWYVNNLQLFVNITPSNSGKVPILPDLTESSQKRELASSTKSFLSRAGLPDWEIDLFYNIGDDGISIPYMVAMLRLQKRSVNFKLLLKTIQDLMMTRWLLFVNGTFLEFDADFNKFNNYVKNVYQEIWHPEYGRGWIPTKTHFIRKLNATFNFRTTYQSRFCLTKLFFCETVTLFNDEIGVDAKNPGVPEIFLVKQQKLLGDAEYNNVILEDGFAKAVRVCLYDVVSGKAVKLHSVFNIISMVYGQTVFLLSLYIMS